MRSIVESLCRYKMLAMFANDKKFYAAIPVIVILLIGCRSTTASNHKESTAQSQQEKIQKDSTRVTVSHMDTVPRGQSSAPVSSELQFLMEWNGQYPYDVKFLDNAVLKKRLMKMLGPRYKFLKSIWDVETPIEIKNNLLYAWAMQAHSGGDPSAVIMADLAKNVLYAGIRQDGHTKLYSEDGSDPPQKLKDWSKEN